MSSPLGIVTLGMLGGSGSGTVTYLQGGTEVEAELSAMNVDIMLDEEEVEFALAAINVDMADEAAEMGIETDEIAVET